MLSYNSFYIAAPNELQEKAAYLAKLLHDKGFVCTSSWLTVDMDWNAHNLDALVKFAIQDLADVGRADFVVFLNPLDYKNKGTGGRHVEVGFALGHGKLVFLVGAITNIFHWHPDVIPFNDEDYTVTAKQIESYVKEVRDGRPSNR